MRIPAILLLLLVPGLALAQDADHPGKGTYDKWCSHCHGYEGDGQGVAASRLNPLPRDFTSAKYKARLTTTGQLPTDEDLIRTIRNGFPYTSMPAFPANYISDAEMTDLVEYLKTFAPSFADEERLAARDANTITIPAPPPYDEEAAKTTGREVYEQTGCGACHGLLGRGDGGSAPTLKDDWGNHVRVADLTQPWTFRAGGSREDIFRTMTTGFYGTPMPGFYNALAATPEESEERMWAIVDYMMYLAGGPPEDGETYTAPYSNLLNAVGVDQELKLVCDEPSAEASAEGEAAEGEDEGVDTSCGVGLFANAPSAMFPLVGQIMEPGRNFYPQIYSVTARAVYNDDEIAFLLTWHDMRAETDGTNAPDMQAALWDDELEALSQPSAEDEGEAEDDIWGNTGSSGDDFWGVPASGPQDEDIWGGGDDDIWGGGDDEDIWGGGGDDGTLPPDKEFSDAVALQFPQVMPDGIVRPYFLFGDAQNPVDIWFRDLAADTAALYVGRGSAALTPGESDALESRSNYDRGEWSVIFKRRMKGRGSITFAEGQLRPCRLLGVGRLQPRARQQAFGLTGWRHVYLAPREAPSWQGPTMTRAGLGVLVIELLVIGHGAPPATATANED